MNEVKLTSDPEFQSYISLDKNFRILAFDKKSEDFFIRYFEKAISRSSSFAELFPLTSQSLISGKLKSVLNGGMESYHLFFDSSQNSFKLLLVPVPDEKNNISRISVSILGQFVTARQHDGNMLRAIIDNIPDYIFVKDRNHHSILSNKKFYENILGETGDPGACQSPMDYFEKEKAKEIIEDNERVMKTEIPVINRPDVVRNVYGKEERVLLTKVPLKNENNEVAGLVGIARDITANYIQERKKELILNIIKSFGNKPNLKEAMVSTLRLLSEELKFDYAEVYKVSINKNTVIRTAFWPLEQDLSHKNKICSYVKGEGLPGRVWESLEVMIPDNEENEELLNNMLIDGEKPLRTAVGIPIVLKDKLISILCLGSVKENKEIDKQYLKEIAIQIASVIDSKRSQDQFNDFFNYSLNLIAVIGLDGYIKMANPSFEYKFGYNNRELLNIPLIEFIHPRDIKKVREVMENAAVADSKFEIRCRRKDGSYLWISWRFSPLMEEENVVYVFGTDITPLKDAYDELSHQIEERKKVQDQLHLSEEKYKSLFKVSPLPMWVLDRDQLKFLSVNQAAIDLYGYTREEFLQMTVEDLWAPDPDQEKRIKEVVNKNPDNFFKFRVRHITKTGKLLYVIVKSNPLIFDGKKARVSLVNDVSEMIQAEEKLMNSEKRFKALVQEGSDLISIVDCDCTYIYNSPASQWVFGMEPRIIKGTNFFDYIHKDDIPEVDEKIALLKTQKRVQLPSYRIKNAQNEWRWVETIVTNLKEEPAVKGIVMNSRDITEFVEQERKLIESLERYDIVAKATSDIVTDYHLEKDEIIVNETASDLLGYPPDKMGKNGAWWDDKIHPDDFEEVKALAAKMCREKVRNLTVEYRFRCANGNYKYILDRSYLITDENGEPKRIIGSMQDITERKQHLIAIENHNKRLKEIAWTQSHVVRTPLAKVMGLVDLLLNYKNDLENIDELLKNILNSAHELDGIIRQIAVRTEEEL